MSNDIAEGNGPVVLRIPSYGRGLALTAAAYAVLHHLGSLPAGLGPAPAGTRWVDWVDLVVPYAVLLPAAATLAAAPATARTWLLFAVGAVAYADGHGIHLAANSVANTRPGETAHLWDEVVGHLVWYGGVALVTAALAATTHRRPRPRGPAGPALALAAGVTWGTNALGGVGTAVPALVLALAAAAAGWRGRGGLPVVLVIAGAAGALTVAAGLLLG
jgi:hypothetical protein